VEPDNVQLGVYAGSNAGGLGLRFGAAYAHHDLPVPKPAIATQSTGWLAGGTMRAGSAGTYVRQHGADGQGHGDRAVSERRPGDAADRSGAHPPTLPSDQDFLA